MDYYMSLKVHADSRCSSLYMTFQRQDILVITNSWSSYLEIFVGHKCGNQSKNISPHATFVPDPRTLDIVRIGYYTHSKFRKSHGLLFPWTLLWTFHYQTTLIQSLWWLIVLQRWPTSFLAIRLLPAKRLQDSSLTMYTSIMDFPMTSSLIVVHNLRPNFGNPYSRSCKLKSNYLQHIISKNIDKLNELIKFWSSIYDAPSTIIKTIGRIYWHLQSLSTIILFKNSSLLTMVIIQNYISSISTFL